MEFNIRQKKVINAEEDKILCLATAACGKALPNSEIVATPEGFKSVSEIKVGDYLIDRQGNPTQVLGVYPQGKMDVYEITFGDGRTAKCSSNHLWTVHKRTWKDKNKWKDLTVEEILEEKLINNDRGANFYIPTSEPVKYSTKNYLIHPYVIGAFLGDGCCTSSYLTISSENIDIPNHIAELLNCDEIYKNPANYNWIFKKNNSLIHTNEVLSHEIREYSFNKKIPIEYKYGDIEQRFELIRGLMDTDGSIYLDNRKGHKPSTAVTFTSTSYQLILDVKEVLGSLGIVSTINEDNRDKYSNDICYRLIIKTDNENLEKLFWLPRKKEIALSVKNIKKNHDYSRTSIRKIEKLNYQEDMTCFYVDNEEHLFLMRDFVVTHNTRVLTERIRVLIQEKGVAPTDIVAITFTNMAAEEMRKRLSLYLGDVANTVFIGTIHSYGNSICLANNINTQRYISNEQYDEILKLAIKIPQSKLKRIGHILIDECQDLSPLEYQFFQHLLYDNIFFVGDNRQSIYGFRGCTDSYLIQMNNDALFKKYHLTENYRNAPNIIRYADDFLTSMPQISPAAMAVKTKSGNITECSFYEALEELEWSHNWGTWFILTRTNKELDNIMEILQQKEIPCVTFKKSDLTQAQLEQIMASNKVKVLTIHMSKGLENKNVIVVGAKTFNIEERKICYVAATRAENNLYWCPTIVKRGKTYKNKTVFDYSDSDIMEF